MNLCECGCGESAVNRFVNGHNTRLREPIRWDWRKESRGYVTPCWISLLAPLANGYPQRMHRRFYERAWGPVPEGLVPDHLCGVRNCVRPTHMEAVTQQENVHRGRGTKLTWDAVRSIRRSGESGAALARAHGVSQMTISNIRNHKSWRVA